VSTADASGGSAPIVLVSQQAFTDFGDRLVAAAPDATFLVASEGSTHSVGPELPEGTEPTVAWFSNDLFRGGQGARWFVMQFMASKALKWVHSSTAGLDSPVFGTLRDRGVLVSSAHLYGPPISEYVLRAVLDHLQHADDWRAAEREARWAPHETRELSDTTWLVVGLGDLGGHIARAGAGLGAGIVGVSPAPTPDSLVGKIEHIRPEDVDAALPRCDVVVLARPANDDAALVDATFLSRMPEGSLIVNVARGSLVDETALLAALETGRPARAVMDVAQVEPVPADSPLWTHPRITLTPHSAGQGSGRYSRGADVFAARLRRLVAGEDPTA
jgi:phosphoglycerate dehydrogenase-like enzyme